MPGLNNLTLDQLGALVAGAVICAVLIFVLIIAYVVLARRNSQSQPKSDLGARGPMTGEQPTSPVLPAAPPPAPVRDSAPAEPLAVDIGARLAGTGREAWLQEATPVAQTPPPSPSKEILRLVRDPVTGQTWAKVAGVRHRSLVDIRDRAVGERVLAAITYALRFSNGRVATDHGVVVLTLPPCDSVKLPAAFGLLSEAQEAGEILRLASDPDRHEFCVQVADHSYRRLVDVADQAVGQRILEGITRLLQFSNGMVATDDGIGMVPLPSLSAAVVTPPPSPPVPPATDALMSALTSSPQSPSPASVSEQERFLRELMSTAPSTVHEPVKPPTLIGSLRGTWRKPAPDSSPALNLVTEINRIFQSNLGVSPLANVDAEVEASPDGGVRIRVGTVYYNSPDDVPDARLRELLKLSIAEWEQQS
jgi:hypothetical protein